MSCLSSITFSENPNILHEFDWPILRVRRFKTCLPNVGGFDLWFTPTVYDRNVPQPLILTVLID